MKQRKHTRAVLAILLTMALLFFSVGGCRTQANAAKTAAGLVRHCQAQLGMFYWYGTFGQAPTMDLLRRKQEQYPMQMTAARCEYAIKNHVGQNKRVYDCAGLVKSYWMQAGPDVPPVFDKTRDKDAQELYALCTGRSGGYGAINGMPEETGLLLFMGSGPNAVNHVGVYLGGGQVIEARGFDYGVVQTNLRNRLWNYWGRLPASWLTDEGGGMPLPNSRVRVKTGTQEYYPGLPMSAWVQGQTFTVGKVQRNGEPVYLGGKRCVWLAEINTWCAVEHLIL